ncbi:MAG: hypothetical protein RLZZ58_1032 [Pseudomonadota bacterium]
MVTDRAPRERNDINWRAPRCAGFQRHHLIPAALLARPQVAAMMAALRRHGYDIHSFGENGLLLPQTEAAALRLGHALHRGPHPGYSDVVAARVETIRAYHAMNFVTEPRRAAVDAIGRLRLLQITTRRALTDRHRLSFFLNRRDPMRLFADRPYLDDAIDRIFAAD